jgi:hypothetical protein
VINFRYHVVSLTAVFFALAIGLVVGTAALNGPVADSLRDQIDSVGQQNQELRDRVNHLNADVEAREQFAEQVAPVVLANRLAGVRVLILFTPSGDEHVDGVRDMLALAGATVTGRVGVTDRFTEPANNDELLDLAHTSLPAGVPDGLPTNSDGVEASAALLGAVLLDRTPPIAETDRRAVLTAFTNPGYLSGTDDVAAAAGAVVFVSGPPYTGPEAARRNAAIVTTVAQLDNAGVVTVAAGADAGEGNVVAEVRRDPRLTQTMSTVDNAGTPQGRLVVAWALAEQIAGRPGHFGIGSGATLLPKTAR